MYRVGLDKLLINQTFTIRVTLMRLCVKEDRVVFYVGLASQPTRFKQHQLHVWSVIAQCS